MHILRIAESPIPVMLVPGQDLLEVSETQAYRLQPNLDLLHRVQQASTRQLLRRSGHPAGRLDASPKRRPRARGGMQAVQATQAGAGMDGSREGDDGFSAALSAEQCRLDV